MHRHVSQNFTVCSFLTSNDFFTHPSLASVTICCLCKSSTVLCHRAELAVGACRAVLVLSLEIGSDGVPDAADSPLSPFPLSSPHFETLAGAEGVQTPCIYAALCHCRLQQAL